MQPVCRNVTDSASEPWVVTVRRGSILVDEQDVALACEPGWLITRAGYVMRGERREGSKRKLPLALHRRLLGAGKGQTVDHIDGNPLNNTRANLRLCTRRENAINARKRSKSKSRYKGVSWSDYPKGLHWHAHIRVDGKAFLLGQFADEEMAARTYDMAAREHYGEFGRYNFPLEGEQCAL